MIYTPFLAGPSRHGGVWLLALQFCGPAKARLTVHITTIGLDSRTPDYTQILDFTLRRLASHNVFRPASAGLDECPRFDLHKKDEFSLEIERPEAEKVLLL